MTNQAHVIPARRPSDRKTRAKENECRRSASGGKYVFGWSEIKADNTISIPPEAMNEYSSHDGDDVIPQVSNLKYSYN